MPTNTVISLRERLARLTPARRAGANQPLPVRTGVTAVDQTLGGGLQRGTVHDIAPADPGSQGAATGFTLALASCALASSTLAPSPEHAPGHMLYIQQTFAGHEAGELYAPGLARLGLQPRCITLFRARRTQDVLWAMEEALKCSGLAAVVAELAPNGTGIDLTASRRLVLAAEAGGGIGLLLHQRASMQASAAATRWAITAAPSTDTPSTGAPNIGSTYGGLGAPAFIASLTKNRSGVTGTWRMTWSTHEQTFHSQSNIQSRGPADRDRTPVPVDRAAASGDRPDRAPLRFGAG